VRPQIGYWKLLRVKGDSMAPTLLSGQTVQARPYGGLEDGNSPTRGAIVALKHPHHRGATFLKRVVGLPNEHVAIADGRVVVDGIPLEEPYLSRNQGTHSRRASQWFTDADEVFLLGDNRGDSEDSRVFGPVPLKLIVGEVWFRYFPPTVLR
jgi:signal peptidase I